MTEVRNCPNCGAPVRNGRDTCEYCGTVFKVDATTGLLTYEVVRPGVVTLMSRVAVPRYAMDGYSPEYTSRYVLSELRNQIAEALTGLIEIEVTDDIMTCSKVFNGRIRVVEPTFRF